MKNRRLLKRYATELSALGLTAALLAFFACMNPNVFLSSNIYKAVFTILPTSLFLTVPLTFVVVAGENDLSFPSTVGIGCWIFAWVSSATQMPLLGVAAAIAACLLVGLVNGLLVTKVKLSSMVTTLGMNYLLRGLINICTDGNSISLFFLKDTLFYKALCGKIGGFPVQMFWGLGFVVLCMLLFSRHRFGQHVCFVGDNATSARETGINVDSVKIRAYMLVGFGAAIAGILSGLINYTFWPTTGDGYLLDTLAAVFLGGTPTWGGVGSIVGSSLGSFIMSFIDSGIVSIGLTGYYTNFFFGLILVLALISHRFSGLKRKN